MAPTVVQRAMCVLSVVLMLAASDVNSSRVDGETCLLHAAVMRTSISTAEWQQ
jgi:hypothetical protein